MAGVSGWERVPTERGGVRGSKGTFVARGGMLIAALLCIAFLPVDASHVCCLQRGVPQHCAQQLCRSDTPPGDIVRYTAFEGRSQCQNYLTEISECLVDGRDSTECCESKGFRDQMQPCLGFCSGSPDHGETHWGKFLSCFALNVDPFYECIDESKKRAPSEPLDVKVYRSSANRTSIRWKAPRSGARNTHIYKLHVQNTMGRIETEVVHDTRRRYITIDNLRRDSRYSAYVVAHARNPSLKSLPSEFVHFSTLLDNETGKVFNKVVKTPSEAKRIVIYCSLRLGLMRKKTIDWEMTGKRRKIISGRKYTVTTIASEEQPVTIVSALEIRHFKKQDFGVYKCKITGHTNEYGEVKIVQFDHASEAPPLQPPETPRECCETTIAHPQCQSICHTGVSTDDTIFSPDAFLSHMNCMDDFETLVTCAMSTMNSAACCIHNKVPYYCLGLCDSSFEVHPFLYATCMDHIPKIYKCQEETGKLVPGAMGKVETLHTGGKTRLSWPAAVGAEVYDVHYRIGKKKWSQVRTVSTIAAVPNSDEISVVAVNKFGFSVPSRVYKHNGVWKGKI